MDSRIAAGVSGVLALVVFSCSGTSGSSGSAMADPKDLLSSADMRKLPPTIHFSAADLDERVDPCVNLDAYVNGKWRAANPIPPDRSSWGPMEILAERSLAARRLLAEQAADDVHAAGIEKIVGDFWATGMDEERIESLGIEPLRSRLDEIDALADGPGVADFLRRSFARGEGYVFGFGPDADFKDSSVEIAYVTQDGIGLPDRSYYFDAAKRDKLDAYRVHIAKVLELAGVPHADAGAQATDVVAFETRLAGASKSSQEMARDVSLFYNPVTPAAADRMTPHFPWTKFFASQGIAVPARFSLAMPDFHREVDRMIASEPIGHWKSYLRFHLVDSAAPYLSSAFVQEYFAFHGKAMVGQKQLSARWKRVLGAIEEGVGMAMGQLYVAAMFPPESKARVDALVQNLETALAARIEHLDWMSDDTKKKALAKLATFTRKIGYPDKWRDWTGLRTSRESYLGNVLAAAEFNYKWEIGKIGKPVDRSEWGMTPQTVNAYYRGTANEIVFPAAILQPPFFDPAADDALNYGSIGAVIGHEITHGFDDQGSRFGPTGNFENWWSEADAKRFAARSHELAVQFDAYEALPGLKVNGELTLGENIADLGGLATAYDAMKIATAGTPDPKTHGIGRDQLFFLSFATSWRSQMTPDLVKYVVSADPHAPPRFRAIAGPSNLPAFAEAFSCKPGQPMARSANERVEIW